MIVGRAGMSRRLLRVFFFLTRKYFACLGLGKSTLLRTLVGKDFFPDHKDEPVTDPESAKTVEVVPVTNGTLFESLWSLLELGLFRRNRGHSGHSLPAHAHRHAWIWRWHRQLGPVCFVVHF